MILYIFTWPSSTSRDLAKLRFRFALFFVKIWRRPGRVLFNFPVPVTLNRAFISLAGFHFRHGCFSFFAFVRDGSAFGRLPLGAKTVVIVRPINLRGALLSSKYRQDPRKIAGRLFRPRSIWSISRPRNMMLDPHLVPFDDKLAGMFHFRLEIMRVDIRLQLDFLDLDLYLRFFAFFFFLSPDGTETCRNR